MGRMGRTRWLPFVVAGVVAAAGLAGWLSVFFMGDATRAWRSLLINFVYFTPLAAGMVVWPAVLTLTRGTQWMTRMKRPALAAAAYGPLSLAAYMGLCAGADAWAPWHHGEHLHHAAWLNAPFLYTRDLTGLVLFWCLAAWFAVWARDDEPPKTLAAFLVVTYAAVFSLLGFDLVMALDPHWYSALFGGYFFMSGMYIAIAGWTLAALLQARPDRAHRHDFGKLIVAFSLLTTYLMYSQLLPIWYENLPHEVRFLTTRMVRAPWRYVSAGLLATIYLGPLLLLLTRWSKMSPRYLVVMSVLVLAGMWVERWWLVTPALYPGGGLVLGYPELSLAAAFAGAFSLAMMAVRPWLEPAAHGVRAAA